MGHSPQQKIEVFNYNKGRSTQIPTEFLKNYRGYLQTNGYGVLDSFEHKDKITLVVCIAHTRRYFIEAAGNDKKRSDYFIGKLQILYKLEETLCQENVRSEKVLAKRQEIALPILQHLQQWLKENLTQVLPQSAIRYALTRWDKLMQYAQNGILQIDNNLIENQIRPVAVGRKIYLFYGSHESVHRASLIYSLHGTSKLHNINNQDWLNDVV